MTEKSLRVPSKIPSKIMTEKGLRVPSKAQQKLKEPRRPPKELVEKAREKKEDKRIGLKHGGSKLVQIKGWGKARRR